MVGDGTVRKAGYVKQGDLSDARTAFRDRRAVPKNRSGRSQSARSSEEAGQRPRSEGAQEGGCVRETRTEETPASVPEGATQAGAVRARWAWTEPGVWTERMLTALEQGVKGGCWFSLMDKVYAPRTLQAAWERVRRNAGGAGVDRQTVEQFSQHDAADLQRLHEALKSGTYRPQAIKRVYIPKPGSREKRPLGIPTVRDRVVQTALRCALEPIFERDFHPQSYGFRPGRGCKDALRRVDGLLKAGYTHVVDADLKGYFDSIPHEPLMARVATKVSDGKIGRASCRERV